MKGIWKKIQLVQLTLVCQHVTSNSYNFNTERFPITVPLNVTLKFSFRGIKSGAFYFYHFKHFNLSSKQCCTVRTHEGIKLFSY